MTARRLSQAISEGDGISILVEVADAPAARAAAAQGAEGLVLREAAAVGQPSPLPVLAYGPTPEEAAAAADAVVLDGDRDGDELDDLASRASTLGLECVLRVGGEEDLERVLEQLDPEIVLLSAGEGDGGPLERLLELLLDVPAGKLAIAELAGASREDVEELERAGMDAVLVRGDVDGLVGDSIPDV